MQKITIQYGGSMSRTEELRLMHDTMICMNDERAYDEWTIYGVPDGATDEDLQDIADDDTMYADACREFHDIFMRYKKHGLIEPYMEVVIFVFYYFQDKNFEFKIIKCNY